MSSPFPWTRRARTTTPLPLSVSSGVSKKNTCRICASNGSMSSAFTAVRCESAGTVSFSSTLSAPFMSARASATCSSVSAVVAAIAFSSLVAAGAGRRNTGLPLPRPETG